MDTKYYKSLKTNAVAELVGKNEHGVILLLEDGDERVLAPSTLKRWWKEIDYTPVRHEELEVKKEVAVTKQLDEGNTVAKPFITAIEQICEAVGSELFIRPSTGSYNLKQDGKIYLFFKVTKSRVVLYTKAAALGSAFTFTEVNHNFNARMYFEEWNTKVYEELRRVHDASLKYYKGNKK